jgi:hypothetical protein
MDGAEDILTASATEEALVGRMALQEQQIADALAFYEPLSATYMWFDTLRGHRQLNGTMLKRSTEQLIW